MAKVNFFLVFEGRAGSGLLRAILNSSPHVFFEAEWMMFNLRNEPDPSRAQNEQVARFFEDPRYRELTCLGFDNKLSDLVDSDGFVAALSRHDARIVVLKRRNLAKQVISALNAIRSRTVTGKVHAYKPEDILDEPFTLDLDKFDAHYRRLVQRTEAIDRFVASRDWASLELFYEDLVLSREATTRRVAEFLDVPWEGIELQPAGRPLKQTPTDLRQVLANFEELRTRYAGTRIEEMVVDPGI